MTKLPAHRLDGKYQQKDRSYFDQARRDFVAMLPEDPTACVLELGCGNGKTGKLALTSGKCREYVGIELMPDAAERARAHLTKVICGDVEAMELDLPPAHFSALLLSEVLEHLIDPWRVLQILRDHLKPGAVVLASSPNIAHWKIIRELWNGRFDLKDEGTMDRTHLRWFTPKTYAELFRVSGYDVERIWPIAPMTSGNRVLAALAGGRQHLFIKQMCIAARNRAGNSDDHLYHRHPCH